MKRFDQINVIPFIDIMLVLLAIVLTTATFISQGLIDVNVPAASSAEKIETPIKALTITINSDSQLFLDEKPLDMKALETALKHTNADKPVIFRVDKQVIFEKFVGIVDLLKANKLEKFSIVTIEK